MKKLLKNKKILIIILIILILISILLIFLLLPKNKGTGKTYNNYEFAESISEIPGTKTYTNEKLKEAHCIDNVCIENVVFYYRDNDGRIDYTIFNRNDSTVSGTLKMVFGDKHVLITYNNLEGKKRIESSSSYVKLNIKNKENYKLEKLSKEDKEKIIKK